MGGAAFERSHGDDSKAPLFFRKRSCVRSSSRSRRRSKCSDSTFGNFNDTFSLAWLYTKVGTPKSMTKVRRANKVHTSRLGLVTKGHHNQGHIWVMWHMFWATSGGTAPPIRGHHRLLASIFPCNAHRVTISHSTGAGGTVPQCSPPPVPPPMFWTILTIKVGDGICYIAPWDHFLVRTKCEVQVDVRSERVT